jgi:hypothetical protein
MKLAEGNSFPQAGMLNSGYHGGYNVGLILQKMPIDLAGKIKQRQSQVLFCGKTAGIAVEIAQGILKPGLDRLLR